MATLTKWQEAIFQDGLVTLRILLETEDKMAGSHFSGWTIYVKDITDGPGKMAGNHFTGLTEYYQANCLISPAPSTFSMQRLQRSMFAAC